MFVTIIKKTSDSGHCNTWWGKFPQLIEGGIQLVIFVIDWRSKYVSIWIIVKCFQRYTRIDKQYGHAMSHFYLLRKKKDDSQEWLESLINV